MSRCRRVAVTAALLVGEVTFAADHPVGGDVLKLNDPTDPAKRTAVFRAVRDPAIAPSLANDPRAQTTTLEISGVGVGDGTTGTIMLDSGLWLALGSPEGSRGFKFADSSAATGVKKVLFQPGPSGGKLVVIARGTNWPYTVTQAQAAISVRFTVGSEVYCALFTDFRTNRGGLVRAFGALAPASCAPLVCGNGVAELTEECDDGNTADGDGCSASCQLENTSALCAGIPTVTGTAVDAVRVASGLSSPVQIIAPRLDPNRVFAVEQRGRIRIVRNGTLLAQPFLAIEEKVSFGGERGLLGLAFHPNYESNGRFFVNYTNSSGDTVIARYQVSGGNPDDADEASEEVLLTIAQPFANHNGGDVVFGPDGYLYVGMGDGGGADDPLETAQDGTTLLGKLLRIDIDVDTPPYRAVPPTNPNAGAGDPLGLIWAKGLRNPWRFSFDRANGDLYVADVGQGNWEEVDYQPGSSAGGENYGWDIFEGYTHCHEPEPPAAMCPNPPLGFTMPIHEYDHSQGCSITGGFVYRGCRMPNLHGTYFYSDYCDAFVRTFEVVGGSAQNHVDRTVDVAPGGGLSIGRVSSFGEDARGELYITDYFDGEVYQIVSQP